jgi:hypothetical protein
MPTLRQLIPDAETLVAMDPTDLSGFILEVLMSLGPMDRGQWNRRNFSAQAARDFSVDVFNRGVDERVSEACAVAWSWLEVNWLICEDPNQGNDWFISTKRGRELRNRAGVRSMVERCWRGRRTARFW